MSKHHPKLGAWVILVVLSFLLTWNPAGAQCTNGNQPECTCETAPVLCTIDELDGYMFSMASYQHPWDGPSPLCSNSPNSIPNNPTWFAFQAWCETITLNVSFSGCVPVGGSIGVQIAVYADCETYEEVSCNVAVGDCNTNDKMLEISGMNIGDTYYFLVDGCLGSYCNVTIDVIGTCGEEMIEDWTEPIMGETIACVGFPENYSVEDLVGANTFHWYIDGIEIDQTDVPFNTIDWDTPGSYELCVDASSDPCIPVTDPPEPICITVEVYGPDAGNIAATPNPLCPGETSTLTATGYEMDPGITQAILVVDINGTIVQVTQGDLATFTHDACAEFTIYSYNFLSADGTTLPSVGDPIGSIDCSTDCCDLVGFPLIFADFELPEFTTWPNDLTVECLGELPPPQDLTWVDNCDGTGTVSPTEQNVPDACTGGTMQRRWEYIDTCGNGRIHIQQITIGALPEPAFVNPPADETVDCSSAPTSPPDLMYTNNGTGGCLISGTVPAVTTGSADICGGTITHTWEFTDTCSRTISHVKNVTVTPADPPVFLNPPADITVDCDNIPVSAPDLMYTNNGSGNCLIAGSISAVLTGNGNSCGGTLQFTWSFTDPCSRTIAHVQNVTILPVDQALFVNPPSDITVDCENIPASAPDLMYTNGGMGNCLIEGTVPAVLSGNGTICGGSLQFTWTYTDQCNRTITHVQNVTIMPAPPPAFQNPPPDITVSCENIPATAPDLAYTNGANGSCLVSGTVPATSIGTPDACGADFAFQWQYTDPCGNTITHTQNIIVDPTPVAVFDSLPGDLNVPCVHDPAIYTFNLGYSNGLNGFCQIQGSVAPVVGGSFNSCGGTVITTWTFTDACGRSIVHSRSVTVEPSPPPVFLATPPDVTVACEAVPTLNTILSYSNAQGGVCIISGTVSAVQTGTYNSCGGSIQLNWTYTDPCGRTIQHIQNVEVLPAPLPQFVNPPADVTVACVDVNTIPQTLNYSNGSTGNCQVAGTANAIQSGSYDACGGMITYSWTFQDPCGNVITHDQAITVLPAPDPMFVNPPGDLMLSCGEPVLPPDDLSYTNAQTGSCEIAGTIAAETEVSGYVTTYTWTYTNPCNGNTITHVQTVTESVAPELEINPEEVTICLGSSFDLASVEVFDLNGTNPAITFHTNTPANGSNILNNPVVSPATETTYFILAINGQGCLDEIPLTIYVEIPPNAGEDGAGSVCNENTTVSLFDFISGFPDLGGDWYDIDNSGINISNPNSVNFYNNDPGTYTFLYVVYPEDVCEADSTFITVELIESPSIVIDSVICVLTDQTYQIFLQSNGFEITSSAGDIVDLGGGLIEISNIPIDVSVIITIEDLENFCLEFLNVNPPNCNCPNILPPVNNGNQVICEGDAIPELSVTVGAGFTANWYSDAAGTTLLASQSLVYTPVVSMPGVYTFYVETYDPLTECVSAQKTQVRLTIHQNPSATNGVLEECDSDNDGFAEFNLGSARPQITSNVNHMLGFYLTQEDAEGAMNALPLVFTNTSPNFQQLFVRVTDQNGCFAIVLLDLVVHESPEVVFDVMDETCADSTDGQLVILSANHTLETSLDQSTWTTGSGYDDLAPGSYTLFLRDSNLCTNAYPFEVEPGLDLAISGISQVCDDNGTQSDDSDDVYTVSFTVTNNLGNPGTFTVSESGTGLGTFSYGEPVILVFPAMGQSITLEITDAVSGCSIVQGFGPFTTCSTDCLITFADLSYTCDDNGTPSDPSDDVYSVTIDAEVVNGGSANMYNVLIDGDLLYSFSYGTPGMFDLPAGTDPITVTIVDSEIGACTATQVLDDLLPCSDACIIQAVVMNIICDDSGTIQDSDDDVFFFDLTVTGVNNAPLWFETTLGINGSFNAAQTLGPFLISDGVISLFFSDGNDPTCIDMVDVVPPAPCSDPCEIAVAGLEIGACDDNNTGPDPDDDTFSITLTGSMITGTAFQFEVTDGSTVWGPFDYNIPVTIPGLPAHGGLITLTITDVNNPNCPVEIEVSQEPCSSCNQSVDAGLAQTITCEQSTVTLEATPSELALSFRWRGPNSFSSANQMINVGVAGLYTVTVTFPDQCTAVDSVRVFVDDDVPMVDAGPDAFLSCDVHEVVLDGSQSTSGPNVIYTWTDSDGNILSHDPQYPVDSAGIYFLSVADTSTLCTSGIDEVVVADSTDLPLAIIYAFPSDVVNCLITSITLSAEEVENAIYLWLSGNQDPVQAPEITITTAGSYQLQVVDTITGCQNRDSIVILDFTEYPFLSIEDFETIDCIVTSVVFDASGSQQGPDIGINWYDENLNLIANDYILEVFTAGYYYAELVDTANGCTSLDTLYVEDVSEYPEIDAGEDQVLPCEVNQTQLDAFAEQIGAQGQISWSSIQGNILSGGSTLSPIVEGEGWYVLDVFNPDNSCRSTDSVFIDVIDDAPSLFVLESQEIDCHNAANGQIQIDGIEGGTEPYLVTLNNVDISGQTAVSGLAPGSYTLEVTDANGCILDTTLVFDNPDPIVITLDPVIELLFNESGLIEAIVNLPPDQIDNIAWSPGTYLSCDSCLVTEILAIEEGEYLLTITDIRGCMETASLRLLIRENKNVFIPNIFSPNNDGINDDFTVFGNENVTEIRYLRIFDRWGELVYERKGFPPNDPTLGWDGRFRDELLMPGVYVYVTEVVFIDGTTAIFNGDITLVR